MLSTMLLLSAMGSAMTGIGSNAEIRDVDSSEEDLKKKQEDKLLKSGCSKFYYGDNYVIARNKANADRKAKRQGLL